MVFARFRRSARPAAPGPGRDSATGRGSIRFVGLSKSYPGLGTHRKYLLRDCHALFPAGHKVALLGRNGAGKSTILRMISGAQDYDEGRIIRTGSVSWPIGYGGSFHAELTGAQNIRFVARVHGVDTDALVEFVQDFAELGESLYLPYRTYSSGMRARLAFAVSMGVPFDCYLVDEVTAVGDQRFRDKCEAAFAHRLDRSAAIMATHSLGQAKRMCDMGAVLNDGVLTLYDTSEEAVDVHQFNLKSNPE